MTETHQYINHKYINTGITRNHNQEWLHILTTCCPDAVYPRIITAKQMKDCRLTWTGKPNQFEPRLLAKMDCLEKTPDVFRFYGINIISSTNSSYLLTSSNIYEKLEYNKDVDVKPIYRNKSSVILSIGDSESSFIDNLRYSGLFESETYLNEPITHGPLLSGRHRCSFNTKIQDTTITTQGVQFETDGCYESEHKILLIEAKSMAVNNFNIRQLYFPYRTLYEETKGKKEIISIFISKDKKTGIFHIWNFIFENALVMSSIKCVGYNKYKFVLD